MAGVGDMICRTLTENSSYAQACQMQCANFAHCIYRCYCLYFRQSIVKLSIRMNIFFQNYFLS